MVVEHLVGIGRRDAAERTAHFLLELGSRLAHVGMGSKADFACPLTQQLLADALGLSAIHVNRVLRQLRGVIIIDGVEAIMRKEGNKLAIEPVHTDRLAKLLNSWEPIDELFPDVDDNPVPLDEHSLGQ